jgi:hypothetical protein
MTHERRIELLRHMSGLPDEDAVPSRLRLSELKCGELRSLLASAPSAPQPTEVEPEEELRQCREARVTNAAEALGRIRILVDERDTFKAAWEASSDVAKKAVGDMGTERVKRKAAEAEIEQLKTDLVVLRSNRCAEHPEQHLVPACLACWRRDAVQPPASQEEPTQANSAERIQQIAISHAWRYQNETGNYLPVRVLSTAIAEALSSSAPVERPRECVIGKYCHRHGFIHGGEAEELRSKVEKILGRVRGEGRLSRVLRDMLDEVDARDSLALLEVAPAETQEERAE